MATPPPIRVQKSGRVLKSLLSHPRQFYHDTFSFLLPQPWPFEELGHPPHNQFFPPDPPSRHIHGQMGLLKTSTRPAVQATTVPASCFSPSLCHQTRDAPSFCCLRVGPREEGDSRSWATHPNTVTSEPGRESPNILNSNKQREGTGGSLAFYLSPLPWYRCQRNARQWACARSCPAHLASVLGPLSRYLLGP